MRAGTLTAILAIFPAALVAQATAADSAARDAAIIAEVEAEGAAFPRRDDGTVFHPAHRVDQAQGVAERRCVAGKGLGPVRSGEFLIGGDITGSRADLMVKIWWVPLHDADSMPPPLVVTGRSLSNPGDTFTYTQPDIAWQVAVGPPRTRLNFFATGLVVPRAGRWLLVATSGPNWGCFHYRTS